MVENMIGSWYNYSLQLAVFRVHNVVAKLKDLFLYIGNTMKAEKG